MANAQTAWRDKIKKAARPTDKPVGRCLVDFLTEDTDSGLRETEKKLLDGCAKGEDVCATADDKKHKKALDAKQVPPAARLDDAGLAGQKTKLENAISGKTIRAEFLRFLILGGDVFAPVHEAGIQLWNVRIDGGLDLRSCKCVSRVALTNCDLAGELWMQDARLDVLLLSGSRVLGFHANRAKLSGAMWLDENFYSEGKVELFGIEIGGRLDCSSGYFAKGIEAPGAKIGGDLYLSRITAASSVSFVNADIGGTMFVDGAKLTTAAVNGDPLGFSRAKIRGDASFAGTEIAAFDWSDSNDARALNAQNVKVDGSVTFGGGFKAFGEVCFNGAEVSKALDFSGGSFHHEAGFTIRAERANVPGAIKLRSIATPADNSSFESFGEVSLFGSRCGELDCSGGKFRNPGRLALQCASVNVAGDVTLSHNGVLPFESFGVVSLFGAQCVDVNCNGARLSNAGGIALDCSTLHAAGSVNLISHGRWPFKSFGLVLFHSARIGKNLQCMGGRFENPNNFALNCEASRISGSVFLGVGSSEYADPDEARKRRKRAQLTFRANGTVRFMGAYIEQNVICTLARFRNREEDISNPGCAKIALDFSTARIGDTLFLGREIADDEPPDIAGSVDLSAAAVRVLVDDGLVSNGSAGLNPTVAGQSDAGVAKILRCRLKLDQFSYDRLKGDRVCNSNMRSAWLKLQPDRHLTDEFKPQPFEQLISVMRAMGYDDEADDIALLKRQIKRKATPLIDIPAVGWQFPSQAAGVIAAAWLAILGDKFIVAFIMLFWLFRKLLAKIGEILLLDWFVGYGYHMARAVFFLLLLGFGFGVFYASAFQQGAIVPADKDVRNAPAKNFIEPAPKCRVWSVKKCPEIAHEAIPSFNPWLYSADVMVPIVTLGQKAAWVPAGGADWVYKMQLAETVLGWVEGFLLVSFVTGLIAKE